jgi:D-alanyl-lipoteichoic acid acyltransferase DltB (MBOAT superfamily)
MLFNSTTFPAFFALVLVGCYLLRSNFRWQNTFLLVASYLFYGWWDWRYCWILAAVSLVDYSMSLLISGASRPAVRNAALTLAIGTNLSLLAYFKYAAFAVSSANGIAAALGLREIGPIPSIALPVGISFITFQSISYSVEVYAKRIQPTRSLRDYMAYVSFFPQLVAGPIERPSNLLAQILSPRSPSASRCWPALCLIMVGMFKKVAVADNLSIYVDAVYSNSSHHNGSTLVLATVLFAFQIYADFSGYTDIAIGIAALLGFHLNDNFRTPYFAPNIQEFWRRWHISLSTWFRDYLYVPLGGSSGSQARTCANVMLVFGVSGLWHGANWNFLIWGLIHGTYLVGYRLLKSRMPQFRGPGLVMSMLGRFTTFALVCVAWTFFRAADLPTAISIIRKFASPNGIPFWDWNLVPGLVALTILLLFELVKEPLQTDNWFSQRPRLTQILLLVGFACLTTVLGSRGGSQFIYFQF